MINKIVKINDLESMIEYDDGSKYIGEVKDWQRHGCGKLILGDEEFYGTFKDDLYHGAFVIKSKKGTKYVNYEEGYWNGICWTVCSDKTIINWYIKGEEIGFDKECCVCLDNLKNELVELDCDCKCVIHEKCNKYHKCPLCRKQLQEDLSMYGDLDNLEWWFI